MKCFLFHTVEKGKPRPSIRYFFGETQKRPPLEIPPKRPVFRIVLLVLSSTIKHSWWCVLCRVLMLAEGRRYLPGPSPGLAITLKSYIEGFILYFVYIYVHIYTSNKNIYFCLLTTLLCHIINLLNIYYLLNI